MTLGMEQTQAGATLEIGKGASLSIGAGMRAGLFATGDASPDGDSWSKDFDVQSIRLYMGGKLNDHIKFTFNTEEIFSDGPVDVLDAIAQFEYSPYFNV